jgi:phosphoglycerol transferase
MNPERLRAGSAGLTDAPASRPHCESPENHSAPAERQRSQGLSRPALRSALIGLGQALFIAALLYVFLDGRHRDIRVPLHFSSDALLAIAQSKSTSDNGWWWFNPRLGAPHGFDALAFPANSNVDQGIVWAVSRFVPNALAAVNLSWGLMVMLSGLTASWCLRRLGASLTSALVAGTLFAVVPYAIYRNIDLFWLVIYLVPFPCTAALLLATGRVREPEVTGRRAVPLVLGCALLGFNYVYYAFFGCFLIAIGAIVGFLSKRDWRVLGAAALCIGVIAGATLINLAPSMYSWSRNGKPMILRDKPPAESETYGLKIRQLISPPYVHPFPPFRWWHDKEVWARFPLENENTNARLGVVGAAGFLGLLGLLFVPWIADRGGPGRTLLAASQLTLAALLLATIGGFGSLFSLLVSPEIRAWSRITPLIAFLALAAVALAMDAAFRTRARRIAAGLIVLAIGLADQRSAALMVNAEYPGIAHQLPLLRAFVGQIENRLPAGAMVIQLPLRMYPNDTGTVRLKPYEHVKLYLVSRTLRWHYPALSNEQVAWQQAASRLERDRLGPQMAAEGFAAIVVDRYGYEDRGAAVIGALRSALRPDDVIADSERYVALDIRSLAAAGGPAPGALSTAPGPATATMAACGGVPLYNVDAVSPARASYPSSTLHIRGSEPLHVTGWAVDTKGTPQGWGVDVVVDGIPFPSVYGSDRQDVADYYKNPAYKPSGFTATVPIETLAKGQHSLSIRLVTSDRRCFYESVPLPWVLE